MMHFYPPCFAAHATLLSVPCEHLFTDLRPLLAIVVCSFPLPLARKWVAVVGQRHVLRRIEVRIGTVGISEPGYLHVGGVVEGECASVPCQMSLRVSPIVPLVDRSYPLTCFLAQPDFHPSEGIATYIAERSTGGLMPEVVRP